LKSGYLFNGLKNLMMPAVIQNAQRHALPRSATAEKRFVFARSV
jgi:hypothetical protein